MRKKKTVKKMKKTRTWGIIKFWKVKAPDVDTAIGKVNNDNFSKMYTILVK